MNFGEVIGCKTNYWIEDNSFMKSYDNIDEYHWNRIKNASLLFSKHRIGPLVKSIDNNFFTISYQIVITFNNHTPVIIPDIKEKICLLIDKMHSLGYGHGDLHINNIGYLNGELFILDHDSVYRTDEHPPDWLLTWIHEGHDWEGSFEEFILNDYETWRTDWLF